MPSQRSLALCLPILLLAGSATASTVERLSADQLQQRSDLIVEGQVVSVESRWNATHTGFETLVQVSTTHTNKGSSAQIVTLIQPGGSVDGEQQIIVGMPMLSVGERARFHLEASSENMYRVLGWSQGVWRATVSARKEIRYAPPIIFGEVEDAFVHFTHNGHVWLPEQMPVAYWINQNASDDLPKAETDTAIFASFATWQDVACSSLAYSYQGETDAILAIDGKNIITFTEADWIYGSEAAAATSLRIAPNVLPEADVAFNGVDFSWGIGPTSQGTAIQDVQGVLTHELGHFSGLSHTKSSIDTMYYSWRPWQSQRSLSADDKLGLCELYPQEADECLGDSCDEGAICQSYARGTLCTSQPDLIGGSCNYDRIECEDFCLFTATDLSTGYCSKFCETNADCPDRFACNDASAGSDTVRVCFSDESSRRIDAGPIAEGCALTTDCEAGYFCDSWGACSRECVEDLDCENTMWACSENGQCMGTSSNSGGCGCNSSSGTAGWLVPLLFSAFFCRRRRRQSSHSLA